MHTILYIEPSPAGPLIFPDDISSLGLGFDPVTSIFKFLPEVSTSSPLLSDSMMATFILIWWMTFI